MRIAFLLIIFLGILSCKNTSEKTDSTESTAADTSVAETPEISTAEKEAQGPYTPEPPKGDDNAYVIEGTKILDGELNATTKMLTYRVKGSTSKEMVIQLMSQSSDIYFNLRVEEGQTIAEKKRQYMFTVASNEILVIDVTSDKPLREKAVISTIISQL